MELTIVENWIELEQLVVLNTGKTTLTNNYMLSNEYDLYIDQKKLSYWSSDGNLYLFVEKDGFYRLYFLINNLEVNHDFSKLQIVLEIIYRGEKHNPTNLIEYWNKSGFKSHLTRDCYFLKASDALVENSATNLIVSVVTSQSDIIFAKKLIDENLDRYTGDRLTLPELQKFSDQGELYCVYRNGVPCGILQAEVRNKINWLGHIVVHKDFRGLGLANLLVDFYLQRGLDLRVNQFQLWVIKDNTAAVRLYEKKGFKYLNRSTVSMLKVN